MKNQLMKLFMSLMVAITAHSEVVGFFIGPATGVAYKEGENVGEGVAADLTNNTKGKQVLINAGNNKAMILAYDSGGPTNTDPHWFAPDKSWLLAVAATTGIDFANSDLVYGTMQRVTPTFDITKSIPFKKDGAKIVYDGTLTGVSTVSTNTGSGVTSTPTTTPTTTPASTNTNPTTANTAATGVAGWAWYIWVIVAAAVIGIGLLLKSLFGGKKGKVVKK